MIWIIFVYYVFDFLFLYKLQVVFGKTLSNKFMSFTMLFTSTSNDLFLSIGLSVQSNFMLLMEESKSFNTIIRNVHVHTQHIYTYA